MEYKMASEGTANEKTAREQFVRKALDIGCYNPSVCTHYHAQTCIAADHGKCHLFTVNPRLIITCDSWAHHSDTRWCSLDTQDLAKIVANIDIHLTRDDNMVTNLKTARYLNEEEIERARKQVAQAENRIQKNRALRAYIQEIMDSMIPYHD